MPTTHRRPAALAALVLALAALHPSATHAEGQAEATDAALTTGATATPAPVLDAVFPDGRLTVPLGELARRPELAPGQSIAAVELARDGHASHHVIAIRDREPVHRHDRSDLVVAMLEGQGRMLLGDEERPVGPRSILYVPRATVHAFVNTGPEPAVAYVVFTPPFDPSDRVPPDAPLPGSAAAPPAATRPAATRPATPSPAAD